MLNIELQSCGLVILIIILLIYAREKSLDLFSRRLFLRALVASVFCVSLDIISIVGIYYATYRSLDPLIARVICKAYLVSLAFMAYQGFLYAAGEFFAEHSHRALRIFYRVWIIAGGICILVFPIDFKMNNREVFSFGLSAIATYVVTVVLIISTMGMAFKGSDASSMRRRWAILVWQGSWFLAAALQFFFPELLLVGFAVSASMMLIYAELENPHEGIDRMTGQFTANALLSYVADRYQHGKTFAAIHIRIEYLIQSVDLETAKLVMLRASNFLNQTKGAYVFRRTDDEFVVIYKDSDRLDEDYVRISSEIDDVIDMPVKVHYVIMPDSSIVDSSDEYFKFHHYMERKAETMESVVVSASDVDEMRKYTRVNELIVTALDEGRVEVFYQPFFNVAEKKFTSAEALVRIRDLDGSIIPPGVFIPIAEGNGLIVPLGTEIFRQVCAFLASGKPEELGLERVEVNLSVAQFDKESPADFVQNIMEEYGVRPDQINLEITETASSTAKQTILKNMQKLIDYGVHFSLDDFGTGRSNLDYFVEMPVDIIKFDYTFTQGYFKSEKARIVMDRVISLMHRMGLAIVAEGVENENQLKAMINLGVEYIQGYYFSKPIPRDEFMSFLRKYN